MRSSLAQVARRLEDLPVADQAAGSDLRDQALDLPVDRADAVDVRADQVRAVDARDAIGLERAADHDRAELEAGPAAVERGDDVEPRAVRIARALELRRVAAGDGG